MSESRKKIPLGASSLHGAQFKFPPVVFGTSNLGNLYIELEESVKFEIVRQCMIHTSGRTFFDTAGKYGAGLALESLGKSLKALQVKPEEVVISNKLGWLRTDLRTKHPTFEADIWQGLQHDAIQKVSYEGILECFEQGNELLGEYVPQLVSVHDPDEYMAHAGSEAEAKQRYQNILEAYTALHELKSLGKVWAIGVGAKDWRIIQKIAHDVDLDWVMIANSMTLLNHPKDLLHFMQSLAGRNIQIVNAAVFQSGFLVGGNHYDYKYLDPDKAENKKLYQWRAAFFSLCKRFAIKPSEACAQFSLNAPGVVSIALSTSDPKIVKENAGIASVPIPAAFWAAMKAQGLLRKDYEWIG